MLSSGPSPAKAVDGPSKKRLACQACQRRKIKCDRNLPCEQCRRKNSPCIPVANQRLPRGRNGGRQKLNGDLTARIAKLESLLTQAKPQIDLPNGSPPALNSAAHIVASPADDGAQPTQYQYLGGAFWASISEELSKIQGDLENDTPSTELVDDLEDDLAPPDDGDLSNRESSLDPIGGLSSSAIILIPPPPSLSRALCDIYFTNVDPLFKVLHAPSVRGYIEDQAPYLDHLEGDRGVAALKFVVFYAALSTCTETQCIQLCGQTKYQVVAQYKRMAEGALGQADYLISNDLTTLQSLIIYLAIRRHEDQTRRTWTLVSLAVRTALALRLHTAQPGEDPFSAQQRSRLWHAIVFLDLHVAVDLASDALIFPGTYTVPLPLNINDSDMVYGSSAEIPPRQGWTDMTFTLMRRQIAWDAHRQHHLPPERSQERQDIIASMRAKLETDYLAYCDPKIPLHAFTIAVGRSVGAATLLHAIRPTKASATTAGSAVGTEQVLSIAVETLSYARQCYENSLAAGWQWVTWRQWHALAVALGALSFMTEGPLVETAWPLVEDGLSHYMSSAPVGQQVQLGRPLQRLAQKAREARAQKLQQSSRDNDIVAPLSQPLDPMADAARWTDNLDLTGAEPMSMEELNSWNQLLEEFPDPMDFGNI